MAEEKTFTFKKKSIAPDIMFALISAGVIIYGLINIFFVKSSSLPGVRIFIASLVLIIPAILFYFQYYSVKITTQYNFADRAKKVNISADRKTLTIIQADTSLSIKADDVDCVEIYKSKLIGTKFPSYSYIIIATDDNKMLITEFTIPKLDWDPYLSKFLSKKKRVYYKKLFNYIDNSAITKGIDD